MSKKKIIVPIIDSFSARYLLYSGLIEKLIKHNLFVIILTRAEYINHFKSILKNKNIIYHVIANKISNETKSFSIFNWVKSIFSYTMNNKYDMDTVLTRQKHDYHVSYARKKQNLIKRLLYDIGISIPVKILRRFKLLRNLIRYFIFVSRESNCNNEIYKKHKPQLFLITSLGFRVSIDLLIEAKKNKVKTISSILNWDNTSSKGSSLCNPEIVITWNEKMKHEVEAHHDIVKNKIFVAGVPHYDLYFKKETYVSRKDFADKYNLDFNKDYIFFGLMSPSRFRHNISIIKLISEIIDSKVLSKPCQAIVRIHPIYYSKSNIETELIKFYELDKKLENIIFQYPKVYDKNVDLLHYDDMFDLANIIYHSSVLLCYFSTLILEGAILDKPTINLFLEGLRDFHYKPELVLQDTHLKDVVTDDITFIARNKNDLIDKINSSLIRPNDLLTGRKWLVNNKIGPYQGKAVDEISKIILNEAKIYDRNFL